VEQSTEWTQGVSLVGGNLGSAQSGQLYVRLEPNAYATVHLGFAGQEFGGRYRGGLQTVLERGIARQLPNVSLIMHDHVRWLAPGTDALGILPVDVAVTYRSDEDKVMWQVSATPHGTSLTGEGVPFDFAFGRLLDQLPGKMQVCATCALGSFQSGGGEDLLHGWYCFRDLGVDPSKWDRWWEHGAEYDAARQDVSALHWCPSYHERSKRMI
jgi:hypothetical protein